MMLATLSPEDRTVSMASMAQGGLRVCVRRFEFEQPYEKIVEPEDDFRVGGLLRAGSGFRFTFVGAGPGAMAEARHPLCLPPNVGLRGHGTAGADRSIEIRFGRDCLNSLTGHRGELSRAEIRACWGIMDRNILLALNRIAAEVETPGLASNVMVEAMTTALIVDLYRHIVHADIDDPCRLVPLSRQQLARIEERSREDGPVPTITELADLCDLSNRQLMRVFKRATGQTLHGYVESVRLERAMTFLSGSTLSLKQISYRLGFSAPSSFSIAFRRLVGNSPSSYRRASRISRQSSPKGLRNLHDE